MSELLYLVIAGVLWQNVVVTGLLGLTPFLAERHLSYRRTAAVGGVTTALVVAVTALHALVDTHILAPLGAEPLGLLVLALLIVGLIAALWYGSLRHRPEAVWGSYLPDVVLDTALFGVALVSLDGAGGVGEATAHALAAGLGFTALLLVLEGIRERLAWLPPASWLAGVPIQLLTLGILALVFTGFEGV